jgi:tetratricopeptide (TPR) repeat protein
VRVVWRAFYLLLALSACAPVTPTPATPTYEISVIEDLRRSGQVFQALYQVEAQAAVTGWTPALARLAGDLWALAGDASQALEFWQLAAAGSPDDVPLARRIAQAAVELQRWPEATTSLDQLLMLAPDDMWAHFQLGLIRIAFDPATAETHLRAAMDEPAYQAIALALINALRENPGLPEGMAAGLVLAALEQWPYAELAFRHAADIAAPYPQALAYAALSRDQQGKPAERWMDEAIALAPEDALVRYLQGLHLRTLGDNVGSLDAFAQAVALNPENPAYHAELGSAYRLLGDLQRAEYWLDSAVRVSDDDPRFAELLALFYADEAENLTEDGVAALLDMADMSEDADVQAGMGWALWLAGRQDEALAAFDAALNAEPDNARTLYYKGRALLEQGDAAAAAELLRRAAATNSSFAAQAQVLLDSLPDR